MTTVTKILTAVLMLFLCQLVSAEGRLGVKGGTNFFILHSENNQQQDYNKGHFGFNLGVTYELVLNKSFAFQPELNYSLQNAEETYYGSKIRLSYVQVPILLRFYSQSDPVSFFVGPQANFLTSAKTTSADGKESGISGDLNQTDVGVTFGIAYVPLQWKKGLTVDIRAYRGMMNVIKSEYDGGTKTRATVVSLTVGYLFGK